MAEKKSKKKLIPIAILLVLGLAWAVKAVFFPSEFLYAGTVEATQVDIPARVASVIAALAVQEGQHVNQGQTLLTLAGEDYRIAAQIADENHSRALKLYRSGSQSKEMLDQLKNRKEDADLRVQWCTVKSPLTGTVLDKFHEPGEWVSPGTRLFTLADLREVWANIYVPQPLIARLSLGMKVKAYLPELGMKEFEGTITKIGQTAEFTPKNVQTREERTRLVFAVKITFPNVEETLKPGMSVEVRLPVT
jgi:HlyD family secretion protein